MLTDRRQTHTYIPSIIELKSLKKSQSKRDFLKEANKQKLVSVDTDTATVQTGDVLQLNVTLMRSFILEQMCSVNSFIREACGVSKLIR